MTIHQLKIFLLTAFFLTFGIITPSMAEMNPIAMITQAKGVVEYSKNGTKWKPVLRNKLLSEGAQIRTSGDGSAKLINQVNNTIQEMGANSSAKITVNGIEKLSGTLSEPQKTASNLLDNLDKRFAKAQRYTTVRRSVDKGQSTKLDTIKEISLSPKFPDLVWTNVGSDYSYELVINDKSFTIGSSSSDMIRYTIKGLTPGKHAYQVKVLQQGKEVYAPKKSSSINWLDGDLLTSLEKGIQEMQALAPGDDFMLGAYMEDHGFTVAAMDMYRKYFQENPSDVDMRPMLIKTYHDLKLKNLQKNEAVQYQKMLSEQD